MFNDVTFFVMSAVFGLELIIILSSWFIEAVKHYTFYNGRRKRKVKRMIRVFFEDRKLDIVVHKIVVKKKRVIIHTEDYNKVTDYVISLKDILYYNFDINKVDVKHYDPYLNY